MPMMTQSSKYLVNVALDGGGGLATTKDVYVKPDKGAQIYSRIYKNSLELYRSDALKNPNKYKVGAAGQFMPLVQSMSLNDLEITMKRGGIVVSGGTTWILSDTDYAAAKARYGKPGEEMKRYIAINREDKGRKLKIKLPAVDGYYQIDGTNNFVRVVDVTDSSPQMRNGVVDPTPPIYNNAPKETQTTTQETAVAEEEKETKNEEVESYSNITPFSIPSDTNGSFTFANKDMQDHIARYYNTFGAPFAYLNSTDICYYNYEPVGSNVPKIGRSQMSTIYSHPVVFSICPGKVTYMPHVGGEDKETIFDIMKNQAQDITIRDEDIPPKGALADQLYEFASDYNDYVNRLNVSARVASIMLGIGDRKMPYSTHGELYKNFDYAYYTTSNRGQISDDSKKDSKDMISQIFWNIVQGAKSVANDDQYIHFFLVDEGTVVNESHDVTTDSSPLKDVIEGSGLNSTIKSMTFMMGGAMNNDTIMSKLDGDLKQLSSEIAAEGDSSILGSLVGVLKGYVAGGRMIIPDMIDRVDYRHTTDCTLHFKSLTGDPEDVFLRCILPTLAILNFALPKQLANNMYGYPYIVKCYQRGIYNTDLAVIGNVRVERGGSDNISWSQGGLSTDMKVTFSVIPLHSSLMGGNGRNPFMFMDNGPLLEYLGNMCGIELNASHLETKIDLFNNLIGTYYKDTPNTLGRAAGTAIANKIAGIFNFN